LHLVQTAGTNSDEIYDALIRKSRQVAIDKNLQDDPDLQLDPDDDEDDAAEIENYTPPTDAEFDKANEYLEDRPLWKLSDEEKALVYKVTTWVAFDQCTRGTGQLATNAPRYATPAYRTFLIRRVQMAEISVYGKIHKLGNEIPAHFVDHMEVLQTHRERELYNNAASLYIKKPDTLYQPKEKTAQAMAGEDYVRKVKSDTPNDEEVTFSQIAVKNIKKIRALQHASFAAMLSYLETSQVEYDAKTAQQWYVSNLDNCQIFDSCPSSII
jgi:hypothetical protein